MSISRFRWMAVMLSTAMALVHPVAAQEGHHAAPAPSSIVVVGSAEVELAPDRASVGVAIETRARTAAAAAGENARQQAVLLRALQSAGVAEAQIQTQVLRVMPEYEYPREGGRPTVTGYVARNGVQVEIRDISRVGAVVDAALAQGATNVSGPRFFLADADSARRAALVAAVRSGMADAAAVASAAGLQLGEIQELEIQDGSVSPMADGVVMMARAQESAPTPVMAGTIRVRAAVRIRVGILR